MDGIRLTPPPNNDRFRLPLVATVAAFWPSNPRLLSGALSSSHTVKESGPSFRLILLILKVGPTGLEPMTSCV